MLSIQSARYFLYQASTDMRKSFDALSGLVSDKMGKSPINGDVYIFINKTRNRIKLLRWEAGGFVLFYKRLESGTFELPHLKSHQLSCQIEYGELAMIIGGISMRDIVKRRRFVNKKVLINNVINYPETAVK